MSTQNYINHIALVLDASGSMAHLKDTVVKVADQQIQYLAQRSRELDQETRVSVYTFADRNALKCVFFDKDVLRMPSLKGHYQPNGQTALIDATIKAISDLGQTAQLYGDHSFLIYVLTDGQENHSLGRPATLETSLDTLEDNWTLACFVPNALAVAEAKKFGFQKNNISVWDTSERGIQEVGEVIRKASDTFMQNRAKGIRGTASLFQLDVQKLKHHVHKLDRLTPGQFRLLKVDHDTTISEFVETKLRRPYVLGEGYYQLMKREEIQPQKKVALYHHGSHSVFHGDRARTLLGLPSYNVKVSPATLRDHEIYVQSTSTNRKLLKGTSLLILS